MSDIYQQVEEDANKRFKESVFQDLNAEEFPWEQLINLLLIEDSNLQDLFGENTLQLAELNDNAIQTHQSYVDLKEITSKGGKNA